MMRIAIAGGTGLSWLLTSQLSNAANAYQVVVLSRSPHPEYDVFGVQVMVVDYNNGDSLSYALHGVNLVICTFSGDEQLNLINAAAQSGVQFFVPSEFEGCLEKRPENDQLDPYSYSSQARQLLRRWSRSSQMKWTVFSCGIFMERFLPEGLGHMSIGYGSNLANAGTYLIDTSSHTAEYVEKNARGHTVRVCMTSVDDVAQFVVAAIDLGPANWPREFTMRGDRLSVRDVVGQCSRALNTAFQLSQWQAADPARLINAFYEQGDYDRVAFYQQLQATVDGRFDFSHTSLNDLVSASPYVNVQPKTFRQWLSEHF
ncbi:hypothetical protein BKA59DRAFT_519032 [Fusarium tricinctum]|uniref:NmrA-like domain-containing protein n=1 Tax=Fusarium tricinctum TaxID=61284 RepID=A0A8K0S8K7_9HYPO|nr:hypothetical protein BKA59DRAFT_519032 [Fusarium tricinctum]